MTPQEANSVIAEFMGDDGHCFGQEGILPKNFNKSLDALVSVWKRMETAPVFNYYNGFGEYEAMIEYDSRWYDSGECKTIQDAAAIATAKAILELKEGES